jgi:hypothetical protein
MNIANLKRLASLIIIGGITCLPLAAQIRPTDASSYAFQQFQDKLLYPETDYALNPAVAASVTGAILSGSIDSPISYSETRDTNTNDSLGAVGGTSTTDILSLAPVLNLAFLSPITSKGADAKAWGIYAAYAGDYYDKVIQNYNYNTPTEITDTTTATSNSAGQLGGLFAARSKDFSWGLSGDYSLGYKPKSFTVTVDSSSGTAQNIYETDASSMTKLKNSVQLKTGFTWTPLKTLQVGVGLGACGTMIDSSDYTLAIDENGDGYADALVTGAQYYQTTEAWGISPSSPATSYSFQDRTLSLSTYVAPLVRIGLTPDFEIFLNGSWSPYAVSQREYYERVNYASSITTDQSDSFEMLDSGLLSGSALLGLCFGKNSDNLLKVGVGYGRNDARLSLNGVDSAGNSLYSMYNVNQYPEFSLGTAPDNGSIISAYSSAGLLPWESVTNSLFLKASWERRLGPKVRAFFKLGVMGSITTETYTAFNLDTLTYWYEKNDSSEITWSLNSLEGLAVEMDKGLTLTLDCSTVNTAGSAAVNTETLPYDLGSGTQTTSTTSSQASSAPFSMSFHLGVNFAF